MCFTIGGDPEANHLDLNLLNLLTFLQHLGAIDRRVAIVLTIGQQHHDREALYIRFRNLVAWRAEISQSFKDRLVEIRSTTSLQSSDLLLQVLADNRTGRANFFKNDLLALGRWRVWVLRQASVEAPKLKAGALQHVLRKEIQGLLG